jgi:hypothetical protein
MSEQDELERLKRLRDQQVSARDPGAKQRAFDKMVAKRHKDHYLTDVLKDLPYKVRWAFWGVGIGLVMGAGIGFIVDFTFQVHWIVYITLGVMVWGGIAGFIMGQARDSGTEGWR